MDCITRVRRIDKRGPFRHDEDGIYVIRMLFIMNNIIGHLALTGQETPSSFISLSNEAEMSRWLGYEILILETRVRVPVKEILFDFGVLMTFWGLPGSGKWREAITQPCRVYSWPSITKVVPVLVSKMP